MHDLRARLGVAAGREAYSSAVVIDNRKLQGTPESGRRGGYDGSERRKG